jgi:hypothetical protein
MPSDGHIVAVPARTRHRPLRMGDVTFLLAETLTAVRRGERVILFDPITPPGVCEACETAYTQARSIVEAAGGLRAWADSAWIGR